MLINNAGIMCKDFTVTEDGLETTVGVNYVGTWLLTNWVDPEYGKNRESQDYQYLIDYL